MFFGMVRDVTGMAEKSLSLAPGDTVGVLQEELACRYPGWPGSESLSFAVNEEYATLESELRPSDVVAVIPPVSGG